MVQTSFIQGSATFSPFKDRVFNGVMTAFVLRNVSDLSLFFTHAFRVLESGGRFVSLDMFPPGKSWFSTLYSLYFYRLVPWIGGLLAHDRSAYRYLAESVENFQPPERIAATLQEAGFKEVRIRKFLNGAVCMHVAQSLARRRRNRNVMRGFSSSFLLFFYQISLGGSSASRLRPFSRARKSFL